MQLAFAMFINYEIIRWLVFLLLPSYNVFHHKPMQVMEAWLHELVYIYSSEQVLPPNCFAFNFFSLSQPTEWQLSSFLASQEKLHEDSVPLILHGFW